MTKEEILHIKRVALMSLVLQSLGLAATSHKQRMKCPLHQGVNQSSFSWDEQWFVCYSCGVAGDQIEFLRQYQGCTFREAIRYLAQMAGIPIDVNDNKPNSSAFKSNEKLLQKQEETKRKYWRQMIAEDKFISKIWIINIDIEIYTDQLVSVNEKLKRYQTAELYQKRDALEYMLYVLDNKKMETNFELKQFRKNGASNGRNQRYYTG